MVDFCSSASAALYGDPDTIAEQPERAFEPAELAANASGETVGNVSASRYIPEYTAKYWGLSTSTPRRRVKIRQRAIACNARSPALLNGVESVTEGAAS